MAALPGFFQATRLQDKGHGPVSPSVGGSGDRRAVRACFSREATENTELLLKLQNGFFL